MPRNSSGVYSLPLPAVITGTVIDSVWANDTTDDLAAEITNSLDRYGRGGMLAPFKIYDGSSGAPGLAFTSDPNSGMWRNSADDWSLGAGSIEAINFNTSGTKVFGFKLNTLSPAQITANQNDYNPTNLSTASYLRLDTDAARDLTGLQGGVAGRKLKLHYIGATTLTLKDESGSSTAANRFALPADLVLYPDSAVDLVYDGTTSRWRVDTGYTSPVMAPVVNAATLAAARTAMGIDASYLVPAGAMMDWSSTVVPTGWLECNGQNVSRTTYSSLFAVLMRTATVTFTNATDKVNWTAHGLSNGDVFKFTTTGGAPTGLTAGTTYYVVSAGTNDFQIAATEGGAAINFTTDGTGVMTGIHAPFGDGDGSTTFTLPDARRRTSVGRGGSATTTLGARLGATGGAETHTLLTAETPAHTHTYGDWTGYVSANHQHDQHAYTALRDLFSEGLSWVGGASVFYSGMGGTTASENANHQHYASGTTSSIGSGSAHNNVQPSMSVVKIIKT